MIETKIGLICELIIKGIPLTKIKKNSECSNVYQLARAEDFNAFLWFVIHKGVLNTPEVGGTEIYGVYEGEDIITTNSPRYSPRMYFKK